MYKSVLSKGASPSEEYYDDLDKLIDWYELNKNIGSASEVKHRAKEKDGATYVGASKDEIKTINNFNEKDEIIDLSKEAEKAGADAKVVILANVVQCELVCVQEEHSVFPGNGNHPS